MNDQQQVRVRRTPRIGVFLGLGAALGVLAAIVTVQVAPADPKVSVPQAIGFLALLLAPVGALIGGAIAIAIDARAERRARVVQAERVPGGPDD